jgi:hypothetical protein
MELRTSEKVIMGEIDGKNAAIHAYDKIIWQVRTGFLTLVFGGWAFILQGAIQAGMTPEQNRPYLFMMIFLTLILAIGAFFVDRNYIRRKFRVIFSLNKLQSILAGLDVGVEELPKSEKTRILEYMEVAGDSGLKTYEGKGYNQELTVSYIIYFIVVFGCLGLAYFLF